MWNLKSYLDFLEGFQQAQTVTNVTRRKMPPVDKMIYRELLPIFREKWRGGRDFRGAADVVERAAKGKEKDPQVAWSSDSGACIEPSSHLLLFSMDS